MMRPSFITFCVALTALALISCGGKKPSGPITITIWEQMDPTEVSRFDRHLKSYMAAHPGVTIEHSHFDTENLRSQFQNAANAGGGPDLVYGPSDQVGPFSILRIILPIDQWVPADTLARFHPAAFDTLDGHIWALPDQIGNHLVLVYNRDMAPQAPADFDELIAMASQNTVDENGDGRMDRYGLVLETMEPFWLIPFLTGFGGWVMDDQHQPTLATPATADALALMYSLKAGHRVIPGESDYQTSDTLFKEKKAAFIINGPWSFKGYLDAGLNIGVAPIPRLPAPGGQPSPMSAAKGYSINAGVRPGRMKAVLDLLHYLTSPEVTQDFADLLILPSRREALANPRVAGDPLLSASKAAYDAGRRMPVVPEMRAIWDAMRPVQQSVMNGSLRPAEAAAKMQQDALAKIASMKQ